MFEEGVPNWYEVKTCVPNDWLNDKLESQQYGIYYSVLFTGDAETYLWQAKTEPVVGEKYYGHVEPAKSGKSMRFKKDKVPEGHPAPAGANEKQASFTESPEKQAHISRSVALNNAVQYYHEITDKTPADVLNVAEEFLTWLAPQPEPTIEPLPSESDAPEADWLQGAIDDSR